MDNKFHKAKRPTREELIKNETLGQYFTWWDTTSDSDWDDLIKIIENAKDEEEIQKYLKNHPEILVEVLGGGHGRWIIPKQKLGNQFTTDFIIGEKHSFGYSWVTIELENPNAKLFTKKGDPTKELTHAIKQIQEWRAWIRANNSYATRSTLDNGLGLIDINSNVPGWILIGRESTIDKQTKSIRQQMCIDLNIRIHSYDYLIRNRRNIDIVEEFENRK